MTVVLNIKVPVERLQDNMAHIEKEGGTVISVFPYSATPVIFWSWVVDEVVIVYRREDR